MTHLATSTIDGNITWHARGTNGWLRTGDAQGYWPCPRPHSREWTRSLVDTSARLVHANRETVEGSISEPPALIGVRLPHYACWSQDGQRLCYVVSDGRSLSLRSWRQGDPGFRTHISAAPIFPAWVPNSDWLLCHYGQTLSAIATDSGEQRVLATAATGFRTPAVSDDGVEVGWAEVSAGAVRVFRMAFPNGAPVEQASQFAAGVALSFRPGSRELTAAVATAPESGMFAELVRLTTTNRPERILKGPFVAFWWSPTGERIAVLAPTYSGDGRFQLLLYEAGGQFLGALEPLIPSPDFSVQVGFFDQYASSHPNWSADGRWFGLCGAIVNEGPAPSFSKSRPSAALVWDTESRSAPERLGPASLLVFGRGEVNEG